MYRHTDTHSDNNWLREQSIRPPRQSELPQTPAALGSRFRTITLRELSAKIKYDEAFVSDCKFLASYNLTNTSEIIVPGSPPLWLPTSDSRRLQPDSGTYFRDENWARFPVHPMDPVLKSISQLRPDFEPDSIDIAACGSTLGNLLRFVQGRGETFSFTVDVIGRTVLFIRRGTSPAELINGVHGFGHSFVESNTMWATDMKSSASHQRIVSYNLGGKRFLVRFEVDAHFMHQRNVRDDPDSGSPVEDALAALLDTPTIVPGDITVLSKGSEVSQSALIDIKTRSSRKNRRDAMIEQMPRLWLRQIDKIVLSFHNNGLFGPPEVKDISAQRFQWEIDHKDDIGRLVDIVNEISMAALMDRERKIEVRYEDEKLHLHHITPTEHSTCNAVSDDLRRWWAERSASEIT